EWSGGTRAVRRNQALIDQLSSSEVSTHYARFAAHDHVGSQSQRRAFLDGQGSIARKEYLGIIKSLIARESDLGGAVEDHTSTECQAIADHEKGERGQFQITDHRDAVQRVRAISPEDQFGRTVLFYRAVLERAALYSPRTGCGVECQRLAF